MSRRRVIPKRIDPLEGVIRPLDLYRPFVAIAEYNVEDGLFCSFGHSIHIVAAFAVRVSPALSFTTKHATLDVHLVAARRQIRW